MYRCIHNGVILSQTMEASVAEGNAREEVLLFDGTLPEVLAGRECGTLEAARMLLLYSHKHFTMIHTDMHS